MTPSIKKLIGSMISSLKEMGKDSPIIKIEDDLYMQMDEIILNEKGCEFKFKGEVICVTPAPMRIGDTMHFFERRRIN